MSPRSMPKIMYGTAWKKERTTELVMRAVEAGFRGIDTACQPKHYREDLVGAALRSLFNAKIVKRDDIFLQTKFTSIDGQDPAQPLPYDPTLPLSHQVSQSFERSISNLGVEYLDSVVLHSPLRTRGETLEAWRALEGIADSGRLRFLGVSNIYDKRELEWLIGEARVPVSVVQNRWYEGNGWDWDIYDMCQRHSIRYQSFWTLTGSPSLIRHPSLQSLAMSLPITPQQAVYKLCQLWNITPLCGSTSPNHIRAALAVEGLKELTGDNEDVKQLWEQLRGVE